MFKKEPAVEERVSPSFRSLNWQGFKPVADYVYVNSLVYDDKVQKLCDRWYSCVVKDVNVGVEPMVHLSIGLASSSPSAAPQYSQMPNLLLQAQMQTTLALLLLGFSAVSAHHCASIPPALWCSSEELSKHCGFEKFCTRTVQLPASTERRSAGSIALNPV
ncbi:hypothetical protein KIN20_012654 [Parelaphostrongylus tenuis]|uniref:Uncharacterized protein n=1 Tax=Parelaphostrongylus tenuis TaxID=148309 RepID=A0AAD5MTN3_PARTN|nr:hypothetical protein KIN20_012654 [Parelaphostrongylus tenuis]